MPKKEEEFPIGDAEQLPEVLGEDWDQAPTNPEEEGHPSHNLPEVPGVPEQPDMNHQAELDRLASAYVPRNPSKSKHYKNILKIQGLDKKAKKSSKRVVSKRGGSRKKKQTRKRTRKSRR